MHGLADRGDVEDNYYHDDDDDDGSDMSNSIFTHAAKDRHGETTAVRFMALGGTRVANWLDVYLYCICRLIKYV